MKYLLLSIASVALLSFTSASGKTGCIDGSGHVISEQREAGSFQGVATDGSMDVVITQGPATEVRIEGEDNILPLITTEVKHGVLVISVKEKTCFNTKKQVVIHATSPTFTSLVSSGSGDITATTKISSESLSLVLSGSGSIKLDVESPNLSTVISGSGDIDLKGHAGTHTAAVNGSGDVTADAMKSETATVTLNGSGNCRVDVGETLTVAISGSGDVLYHGAPHVQSVVNGSGRVRKI